MHQLYVAHSSRLPKAPPLLVSMSEEKKQQARKMIAMHRWAEPSSAQWCHTVRDPPHHINSGSDQFMNPHKISIRVKMLVTREQGLLDFLKIKQKSNYV